MRIPAALISLVTGLVLFNLMILPAQGMVVETEREFTVMQLPRPSVGTRGGGFEPHILAGPGIDGNQWYYVDSPTGLGNTQGGNLWISKDHGETWEWYDKDSLLGTSGDSYTAVSEEGAIYYTDLYLSTASVDSSVDGGETWIANPFASVYVLDDRQWLYTAPNSLGGENIYFAFNQIPGGLVMVKAQLTGLTGVAVDWVPCNNGLPITSNVGSRDNIAVDRNNGNIYCANYQSNGIFCYISTNEGASFSSVKVNDETVHAKVQNTFMDIIVDTGGNIYMMWSSRDDIYIAISRDAGQSWQTVKVTEKPGCRVLPWIAAGDPGRIAMIWYETPDVGNPNNLDDSVWDLIICMSFNALDEEPVFEKSVVQPVAHVGSVRTSGLDGDEGPAPDRDLGDFIGIDVDEYGRAIAIWGYDGNDGPNTRQAVSMFGRQEQGPFLFEGVGPVANFTLDRSDMQVTVDASLSEDLSGSGIVSYEWNWGDGSENTTTGEAVASHRYNSSGEYTIRLQVTNANLVRDTTYRTVVVEKPDEEGFFENISVAAGGASALLILFAVLFAVSRTASRKRKGKKAADREGDGGAFAEGEIPDASDIPEAEVLGEGYDGSGAGQAGDPTSLDHGVDAAGEATYVDSTPGNEGTDGG